MERGGPTRVMRGLLNDVLKTLSRSRGHQTKMTASAGLQCAVNAGQGFVLFLHPVQGVEEITRSNSLRNGRVRASPTRKDKVAVG